MQFGLTESQKILKDNARRFFSAECPIAEVRRLMASDTAFDPVLWKKMAEQGFTGIIFPEEFGGLGLGKVELALLMEEMGYALVPGPFFSTVVLAGSVLDACGSAEQKKKYLEPICNGQARATVALILDPGAAPNSADGRVTIANGKLTGRKLFVPDAAVADFIAVVTSSGVFVVDTKAGGVKTALMNGMDRTRKLYSVEFNNAAGEKLANATRWAQALDLATAALVAEMVGGMQRTIDITVQYAKTRKQFGKPIGSFQAVQHQCAEMYASDACRNVGNHGIQVHGGMGFTWENDLHLYYRRAKASETMLGDATHHRERIARLVIDKSAVSTQTAKSA